MTHWYPVGHGNTPHACHVLAARFDEQWGEWIYGVVLSPPSRPFTHWTPLPDPPRDRDAAEGGDAKQ